MKNVDYSSLRIILCICFTERVWPPLPGRWIITYTVPFSVDHYTLFIFNLYFVLSKNAAYFTSLVEFFCRTFVYWWLFLCVTILKNRFILLTGEICVFAFFASRGVPHRRMCGTLSLRVIAACPRQMNDSCNISFCAHRLYIIHF